MNIIRSFFIFLFLTVLVVPLAFAEGYSASDFAKDMFEDDSVSVDPLDKIWKNTKIEGEVRVGFGIESDGNVRWRRANGNLNERDFRLLSDAQLNHTENTYDPAIYSRLKVLVDSAITDAVSMHMNITVDPWSYVGKSDTVAVTGSWGTDVLKMQYLYWGNTNYTIPRNLRTSLLGDGLALPEIKVKKDKVQSTTLTSVYGDTFTLPEMKIDYTFNPLRELWFDVKPGDKATIRIFPMAYDNQALTSDDPLKLSNNKMYWEESPWVRDWTQGNINTGATPVSFTEGKWDRTLANYSRDSDGQWLTALRGVSLDMKTTEDSSLKATIAAPKNLWQDYDEVTAVPGALRWKQFFGEKLFVGTTGTMHLGLVEGEVDAENYVKSADLGFSPMEGLKVVGQVSSSTSVYDKTTNSYESHRRGNAYYGGVELASAVEDQLNRDYFGQHAPDGAKAFGKTRLFFAMMEQNFQTSLSNYHETRDDSYWSRHITFYPSTYGKMPGTNPSMSEYDFESFAIGSGLDYGRKVIGWRGDAAFWDGRLKGLADVRYVTTTEDKYIETVSRTQWQYKVTDKLTAKAMLLNHDLPKTTAGVDPFVVDGETGAFFLNNAVTEGNDPSLNTGTLGARYEVTDWIAVNGVWERTNDITLGADNFPRGILNSASFTNYYDSDGRVYSRSLPFMYSQGYFDQAPYQYRDIFKTGLELNPTDKWTIYLDYTRNPNRFAGNIDDNMNHFGIETCYVPNPKWGFFARYTFSRWYDLDRLINGNELKFEGHNNMFLEARYHKEKDTTVTAEYGVGPGYFTGVSSTNPSMAYYAAPVLDTQHIIRLIYQKKF